MCPIEPSVEIATGTWLTTAEREAKKAADLKFVHDVIALCNQAGHPQLALKLAFECDTLDEVRVALLKRRVADDQAAGRFPSSACLASIRAADDEGRVTASDVKAVGYSNSEILGDFNAFASDGKPLAYAIAQKPEHGSVELGEGARFIYTPDEDYVGNDAFTYVAASATSASGEAAVSIEVMPSNSDEDPKKSPMPMDRGRFSAA